MSSTYNSRDMKLYPMSKPYQGGIGAPYYEFSAEFISALDGYSDKTCVYGDLLRGTDPGGIPPLTEALIALNGPHHLNPANPHAPAHVGQGAVAVAARAESVLAARVRDLDMISKLRAHLLSERLIQMLDRMKELMLNDDYAGGAPVRAAAYPMGHPLRRRRRHAHRRRGPPISPDLWL